MSISAMYFVLPSFVATFLVFVLVLLSVLCAYNVLHVDVFLVVVWMQKLRFVALHTCVRYLFFKRT
eukprot:m.52083 g.52083  ORF g.52083 m.52083 type:complete len:66 (+) comp11280_c0_seq2:2494-2691(+)